MLELNPNHSPARRRVLGLAIAGIAVLVLCILESRYHATPPNAPGPAPEQRASEPSLPRRPATIPFAQPREAEKKPSEQEPAPIIDSVTIEKPSVCSGEENLVKVKAHTTNGTDEYLHYVIDGQLGPSVPVRLWQTDHGTGVHSISVFGRENVSTTIPLPDFEVRDCVPPRLVHIEKQVHANTWSDYDFVTRVVTPRIWNQNRAQPAKPFVPKLYQWSFGDGQSATTSSPVVEHNYEGRTQDSLYSNFLVSVEIRSTDNQVIRGRTSLSVMNPAFEALYFKGIVALMISLNPRFPELGSDGKVTQEVRLWHTRPGPVRIERATRTRYFKREAGESSPEEVDVVRLLGAATIPPGSNGITARLVLDPASEPDVFSVTYAVSGTSEEGYPVGGSFSVMRPPPNPTRGNSIAVNDPTLKAKIVAARGILRKDFVSDEDLFQLERAGQFVSLSGQDSASSPTDITPMPLPSVRLTRTRDPESGPFATPTAAPRAVPSAAEGADDNQAGGTKTH